MPYCQGWERTHRLQKKHDIDTIMLSASTAACVWAGEGVQTASSSSSIAIELTLHNVLKAAGLQRPAMQHGAIAYIGQQLGVSCLLLCARASLQARWCQRQIQIMSHAIQGCPGAPDWG